MSVKNKENANPTKVNVAKAYAYTMHKSTLKKKPNTF